MGQVTLSTPLLTSTSPLPLWLSWGGVEGEKEVGGGVDQLGGGAHIALPLPPPPALSISDRNNLASHAVPLIAGAFRNNLAPHASLCLL